MKRILIACVNHNSHNELSHFLASVDVAASNVKEICEIVVLIADNSTNIQSIDSEKFASIQCLTYFVKNTGYINSAQEAILNYGKQLLKTFDFTIVSNVDICLAPDFFKYLTCTPTQNVAWIAPRVHTPLSHTEENPYAIHRYSNRKLQLLRYMYAHPHIFMLHKKFTHILIRLKRNRQSSTNSMRTIYAGHGSILIFTQAFVEHIFPFNFPFFLYGEELYFAELARLANMQTIFNPQLYVNNCSAHVSTSKLDYVQICKYGHQAISYILNTYY